MSVYRVDVEVGDKGRKQGGSVWQWSQEDLHLVEEAAGLQRLGNAKCGTHGLSVG